jgi:hypothetical protein
MLAFLQGSAAHAASSLLEQRSAGALLKLEASIYTCGTTERTAVQVHANIMYGGSSREPPGRRSRHFRLADFQEGGSKSWYVIDPEMGKGQMLDGELCVIALPKRHVQSYIL